MMVDAVEARTKKEFFSHEWKRGFIISKVTGHVNDFKNDNTTFNKFSLSCKDLDECGCINF
jgi:hypothetical protein